MYSCYTIIKFYQTAAEHERLTAASTRWRRSFSSGSRTESLSWSSWREWDCSPRKKSSKAAPSLYTLSSRKIAKEVMGEPITYSRTHSQRGPRTCEIFNYLHYRAEKLREMKLRKSIDHLLVLQKKKPQQKTVFTTD